MDNKNMMRYVEMPVFKAILENALPAMAAMMMVLIYNLADTIFIGRTNDPYQVAAISLCIPIFTLCLSLGTIFGIGGTSLISRMLGEEKFEKAKKICSFCFYGGSGSGLLLTIIIVLFCNRLLALMGATDATFAYARSYLLIVAISCPFTVIANSFNNILRSEGRSKEAMGGQLLGNLINIILDPIFISALKLGITGAAIATVIGNVFAAFFYIAYFLKGESTLSIRIRDFAVSDGIAGGVFAIGVPAALGSFLMSASQIIANKMLMEYGDLAVAGYGVSGKVSMIAGSLCIGLGQGVQPLMSFCVGSRNKERFKELVSSSLIFAAVLSGALTLIVFLFRQQIVYAFIHDVQTVEYAVRFTMILLSTGVLFGIYYVLVSILQAMGKAFESLIVNMSRQGLAFIPCLFIMNSLIGINGVVWAQPLADVISIIIASLICIKTVRSFMASQQ